MYRVRNVTHKLTIGRIGDSSKKHYLLKFSGGKTGYFKVPFFDDSTHYLEKFAYELGRVIRLSCAKVELAQRYGCEGSVSYNYVRKGEKAISGDEIIRFARIKRPKLRSLDYSLELVIKSIETLNLPIQQKSHILKSFFEMIIFKYLIQCSDIDGGNWVVLRNKQNGSIRFAPIFDNEYSFRFELSEIDKLRCIQNNSFLKLKLQTTCSGISVNNNISVRFDQVINYIAKNYYMETKDLVYKINDRLKPEKVDEILMNFDKKFSELEMEYLKTVIFYTKQQLVQLYKRNRLNLPKGKLVNQSEVLDLIERTKQLRNVVGINKMEVINR